MHQPAGASRALVPERGRLLTVVLMLLAVAATTAMLTSPAATAGTDNICNSAPTSGGGDCPPGPRHTLTYVFTGGNSGDTCAGAWSSLNPLVLYASYACQGAYSSHPYNAGNLLYGDAHNHLPFTQSVSGDQYW